MTQCQCKSHGVRVRVGLPGWPQDTPARAKETLALADFQVSSFAGTVTVTRSRYSKPRGPCYKKIETQRQAPHAGQLTRPARTNLRVRVHDNGAGTVTRGPAVGNHFGDGWSRNYSRLGKGKSIGCQVVRHVFPEIAETKDSDLEINH